MSLSIAPLRSTDSIDSTGRDFGLISVLMNSIECVQGSADGTNGLTDGTIGTCTSGFANSTMEPGSIGKNRWYHWETLN